MSSAVIKIKNLSKTFRIPHEKRLTLRDYFSHPFRRTVCEKFEALKDISFEVEKGEWIGVIGRNGSGKSTLLKILAGVYAPDGGKIEIQGKVVPLLELGVGFNPELSGRENVYLNGTMLGMSKNEIRKKFDAIVDFAEIRKFLDLSLKNYSSGMQVRLAFAIASQVDADIYLLDEVLAVGDAAFQKKCSDIFKNFKNQNKAVILVSHDLANVEKFCSKVILLEKGEKLIENSYNKAIIKYNNIINSNLNISIEKLTDAEAGLIHNTAKIKAKILGIKMLDKNNQEIYSFNSGDSCKVELTIKALQNLDHLTTSCHFITDKDVSLAYLRKSFENPGVKQNDIFKILFEQNMNFVANRFKCYVAIGPRDLSPTNFYDNNFHDERKPFYFSIINSKNKFGCIDLESNITLKT